MQNLPSKVETLPLLMFLSLFPNLRCSTLQSPGQPLGFKNARSINELSEGTFGHYNSFPKLFVSLAERMKCQPISIQRLSKWVLGCILICYESNGMEAPHRVTAHSSRAQSTSMARLKYIPIREVYRTAIWSSIHTFCQASYLLPGITLATVL